MTAKEAAQWFKGKRMVANKCELILVHEWRSDCYVLLCQEETHSEREHLTQFAELRARGIPVSHDNTVVLMKGELETVAPLLASCSEIERQHLRNALLTLKLSFRGRVLSADEFRQQAESATMATLGSRSRAISPGKTIGSRGPTTAIGTSPPTSNGQQCGSKTPSSPPSTPSSTSSDSAARSSPNPPASTAKVSSKPPLSSFASRLKKLAAEEGTRGEATS